MRRESVPRADSLVEKNLVTYATAHLLVDGTCAALIFSLSTLSIAPAAIFYTLILLYDLLAFAAQPFFGLIVDKFRAPKISAILGSVLVLAALPIGLLLHLPLYAILIAGVGNALFHLGGGTVAFNLSPGRATMPGLFVAPGVIGLLAGTLLGKTAPAFAWFLAAALMVTTVLIYIVRAPKIDYAEPKKAARTGRYDLAIALILVVIAIRSMMGFVIDFSWKSDTALLIALTLGIFLGKAVGGVLADRFGWRKVAVVSLIVSAPLVSFFGGPSPIFGIIGMFLFNMTTPVTLTFLYNLFSGRPAFAFGMNCLALIIGALVVFSGTTTILSSPAASFSTILLSALVAFVALGLKEGKPQ